MLTSSYPKYPGETTAPFIEEIAAGLARRGHTVHVVAPFHRDVRRAPVERGVHLHFFRYSPIERLNVWGYAESLHADISVKGRTLMAAPLAVGASLRALLQVTNDERRTTNDSNSSPSVVRRSSFDIIHAHWVLPNAVPAALAARLRGLPLVISLHGSDIFLAEQALPLSLTAGAAMRSAAMVTACSGDLRERAVLLGAIPKRVEVIPYGVDPQAFRPDPAAAAEVRAELGLPADAPLIVTVSRLVYKKGLTYLLEALPAILAEHPCATLVMAGYGDLRDELERRAHDLGVAAHVRFPGQLERERAARFISAADVYVVPSVRDQRGNVDGLPNALLEGMGAARPIVASRVAGIPEVITDGEHGLLVPERDPAALAAAVSRLLGDRALAARLGAAARQRITTELTWDQTAARFEAVYRRAVGDTMTR
ncbi:MAG TPA: glycosyltransferase [Roseiflexaceae bacterium]|nr:glycosyltransferase [Roseiflexaceae bacterium]